MATILLVEDDSNLREIYGARLEAEGYTIVSANDGEEALTASVREKPDLIISDVMMPKISGFDMLDILRSTPETKDVKVVMMTALGQDEDRERGKSLGADHYLVKSQVTLDDVVNLVREILGEGTKEAKPHESPATDTPPQTPTSPPANSDDDTSPGSDLDEQIEDFVNNSPLMNGVPPQSKSSDEPK